MNVKEKHNYGIDLLRIVAMLMIIAHHFSLHSGINFDSINANSLFMSIMTLGGKIGVNLFILITGYYSTGKIKRDKVVGLISDATIYSIVLTMIAILCGYVTFSKKMLLKAFFPLLFGGNYWFIVTYIELYLLSPLLNVVIKSLKECDYKKYLIYFMSLLCVFPSIIGCFIQTNDFGYSTLTWFIFMYFIGAYLKLYIVPKISEGGYKISLYIITVGLIIVHILASIVSQTYTETTIIKRVVDCFADYNMNAIMPLLISVFMFIVYERLKINRGQSLLQKIGSTTLGIYLFHDNVNFRKVLWDICKIVLREDDSTFILLSVLCIVGVFSIGIIIEMMREFLEKRIYHSFNFLKEVCRRKNV